MTLLRLKWLLSMLGCIELGGIYLLPKYQRRGIGSGLVASVIDQATLQRLPVRLGVAKINPARSLYERLGFIVVRESEFKYFMERPCTEASGSV
jgi:ribosomal protein S18 acetylase RimI-like enzyme